MANDPHIVPLDITDRLDEYAIAKSLPIPAASTSKRCRCGYPAGSKQDLDEHVLALMAVDDGSDHGER